MPCSTVLHKSDGDVCLRLTHALPSSLTLSGRSFGLCSYNILLAKPKHRATALIRFEGPMLYDKAVKREPELGLELEQQGFKVYGPQKIKS